MALTGNKGEWSEIYALFKLLGDGVVYAGDEKFNRIEGVFYPIVSILRREKTETDSFVDNKYDIKDSNIVIASENGHEFLRMPCESFLEISASMLELMKTKRAEGGTFSLPDIENFMTTLHCHSIKAKPVEKADIRIIIHDYRTGINPLLGFSIKSQVGNSSTLINAGATTNIVYRIEGIELNKETTDYINSICKGKKIDLIGRVRWIYNNGGILVFNHYENDILSKNLMMIDTILPQIVQKMLLSSYLCGSKNTLDLLKEIEKENFMAFDLASYPLFYRRKVANMLVDAALGMVPKTKWDGKYAATGGYLIVKEDGDVLCYHFYNRNMFEEYLLNNTCLDTPGKHELNHFGTVYQKDGLYYLNLELQVRFKE